MRRRTYISLAGVSLLAGCSSSDNDGEDDGSGGSGADTEAKPEATDTAETESGGAAPATEDAKFELVEMDFPEEVALEEVYTPEITVRNTGDVAGTLEAPMYSRISDTDWEQTGTWTFEDVESGTERTEQGADGWHHNYLYEYGYSLGDFDTSVSVDTTPFRTTIGETYPAPNGVEVTVTELRLTARYQYQDYDGDTAAKEAPDGSQWALVTLQAKNRGDEAADLPSTFDVNLIAEKSQYEEVYIDKDENQYDGGEVQPGIVREGWIAYELPDDLETENVEVVWSGLPNGGEITAIWTPN